MGSARHRQRLRTWLALLATASILVTGLPAVADAGPGPAPAQPAAGVVAGPPPYVLQPVSGLRPDESDVYADDIGISDSGDQVLYQVVGEGYRRVLAVRDRGAGTTVFVDHRYGDADQPADRPVDDAAISGDGRAVIFASQATDLTEAGNQDYRAEAYVRVLATGALRQLPRPAESGAADVEAVAISGHGSRAAVLTGQDWSMDGVPGFTVYTVDLADDTILAVEHLPGWAGGLALSEDGSTVAYLADTTGDSTAETHLLVAGAADLVTAATRTDWSGGTPVLDRAGATLAYRGPDGAWLVVDRDDPDAPTTVPVPGGAVVRDLHLSADGHTVVYDDALYDEGGLDAAVWSVTLPAGEPVRVAGTSDFVPQDGENTGDGEDGGEELPSPYGNRAVHPAVSADGSVLALWLDGTVVAATRSAGHADTTAPTWPDGARLSAAPVADDALRLSWPAATDDRALRAYELTADGRVVATVTPATLSADVPLSSRTAAARYTVRAIDTSGNAGAALELTTRGPGTLDVQRDGPNAMALHWEPAQRDDLAGYRILRAAEGQLASGPVTPGAEFTTVAEVGAGTTGWTDAELPFLTHLGYRVQLVLTDGSVTWWSADRSERTDLPDAGPLTVGDLRSASATLTWAPAPASVPVLAYRLQRQQQKPDRETTWTDVAGIPAGAATSFVDQGLAPRAQYRWRVLVDLSGGWPRREWTQEALGSTTSEGISTWSVDAPRTADGVALVLGTDLVGAVTGEPGMHAELRLWQSANPPAGTAPDVVLPMTEVAEGSYRAAPYRLDGTLTAIGTAEVVLTDGARTFSRAGTVGPVSGTLNLTIGAAADELPGLQLVLRGPRGVQRQDAAPSTTAAVALSPGLWDVSLVTSDGDVTAAGPVTVQAGKPAALVLTPERHVQLTVTVTPPAGQPVDAQNVLVKAEDGTLLGTRAVSTTTGQTTFTGLPAHTRVVVSTALTDRQRRVSQPRATVDLVTGAQAVQLQAQLLPAAELAATVTAAGAPLGAATVTVTQRVDDRDWTFTGTTDAAGQVRVGALAGAAQVTATADRHLGGGVPAALRADAVTAVALDLVPAPAYVLRPRLLTTNVGSDPVEQPLERITTVHLHAELTVAGRPVTLAPAVPVTGNEGDEVRLCADGYERGLSKGCTSVRLGAAADVPVQLELTQAASISARLRDADGKPVDGWWADVLRVTPDGSLAYAGDNRGTGTDAVVGVAQTGQYRVVFASWAGRSAPMTVGVAAGSQIDLGTVTLRRDTGVEAGATLTAIPEQVLPGGALTFRVSLPAGTWANRTALLATVPAGATLQAKGVLVDGAVVTPSLADGVITVPLTGAAGSVVRYTVLVGPATPSGPLASIVRLAYDGGAKVAELGTVLGVVTGVTLNAARVTTTPTFRVTGSAPAGAAVQVREDDTVVGTAVAGAGGRWDASVTLPHVRRGSMHTLVATAQVGSAQVTSESLQVGYDDRFLRPRRVEVDNAGVTQPGRRTVTFDPSQGVATFTMVFAPSAPVTVRAVFDDASRVRDFTGYLGGARAKGSCDATACTAVLWPAGSSDVGDIWMDYDVDAVRVPAITDVPVPTLDDLRHTVPAPFNDPRLIGHDREGDRHTFRYALGATGATVEADVAITTTGGYSPSGQDAAMVLGAGVPVQDMSVTGSRSGDTIELRLHVNLPQEFLLGQAPALRAALAGGWVTALDIVFKIKAGLGISINQLHNMFGTSTDDDVYRELQEYIAENFQACAPDIAQELYERLEGSRLTVLYYRGTSDALNGLGLLGGTWTSMAEGIVAAGAEAAIGESVDLGIGAMVDKEIADITAIVKTKPLCDKRIKWIPPDYKWPTAKPTWIFDPSGVVYQALDAQRLGGVTATVLTAPSADGPWTVWDAAAFGQTNPQQTTDDGGYGWDVPVGWWKVRYEKDGYRTAESQPMQVLPERYGVDVDLHPTADPKLTGAALDKDGIALEFDMWMRVGSVAAGVSLTDAAGNPIAGTVVPVAAQASPAGVQLARQFRFVPSAALPAGAQVRLTVAGATVDHGGVALGADVVRTFTVPGVPQQTPGQQVLAGFDALVAKEKVAAPVASELRTVLRQVVSYAEAGKRPQARVALLGYEALVVVDVLFRRVSVAQGKALAAFAGTAAKVLAL